MQVGDGDGVAAAEAGAHRAIGQFAGAGVPGGTEASGCEGARIAVGDPLPGAGGPGEAGVAGGDGRPDLLRICGMAGCHGFLRAASQRAAGGAGEGCPMTRSAAVGKHSTQVPLIRYSRAVPRSSARTKPTAASCWRWADTVDWPTGTASTICLTVIGPPLRASSET